MEAPKLSFVSNETKRIELDGGWVEVKTGLSFQRYMEIMKGFDANDASSAGDGMLRLLQESVVGWSSEQECTKEAISNLSIETIVYLGDKLIKMFSPDKKKLES